MPSTGRLLNAVLPQPSRAQDNGKDKILTGWQKLDDLLSGGVPRQEIIAIAANSDGVSKFAGNNK